MNEYLSDLTVGLFRIKHLTFASIKGDAANKYVLEWLQQQCMVDQQLRSCSCHGCREMCVAVSTFLTCVPVLPTQLQDTFVIS